MSYSSYILNAYEGQGKRCYFLLASPETLNSEIGKRVIGTNEINFIMLDECHVTVEWAKEFRKDFGKVHEIRCLTEATMGLFTATISNDDVKKLIVNAGVLKQNMTKVADSPDRPEIFLRIKKSNKDKALQLLAAEFKEKGMEMDRTFFFIDSINKTTNFDHCLQMKIPNLGEIKPDVYISDHFSSAMEDNGRKYILKDFSDPSGNIKVLFTTVSYGMGKLNKYKY